MQANKFQPDDLFAQIQTLVDGIDMERKAREAAEVADAAKSALLSVISRELRAPMESVVTMAELLRASRLDASQQCYVETLVRSARSLLSVIDEVVDFSKLESGEVELDAERFDLHGLVRDVASALHTKAAKKGLTTGVDMGANCPRFVVGDEARVRQVLMGLIEAALESTSEGSVRLYVSVNDAENPLTVRFDITETGAGLSEEEQARLFQPSVDTSRAGGGLGLPIARRLAEAMGGEVGCNSALGQGTLYWFAFKAGRATGDGDPLSEDRDGDGKLTGHVLVVEDNAVNRMLIGGYLDEFGLTYEMVENGAAALMCLAARPYDLVLMDTVLPDYDGLKVAKRVRTLQGPSEVPIVALAVSGEKDEDYVAAGMSARVSKPIHGPALYAALVPFVSARRGGEALAEAS